MAFFTSRVDDFGNEIERRPAVSTVGSPPLSATGNLSDCMSQLSLSSRSSFGSDTLIRRVVNVNLVSGDELMISDSESEFENVTVAKVSHQPIKNLTFRTCGPSRVDNEMKQLPQLSPTWSMHRKMSTTVLPSVIEEESSEADDEHPKPNESLTSYDEQLAKDYPGMFASDAKDATPERAPSRSQLRDVPSLDLQSEPEYQSSADSYFYGANHGKLTREPDQAYQNWLSAKRRLIQDQALQKKSQEELKKRQQDERKKKALEQYDRWLESKAVKSRDAATSSKLQPVKSKPPSKKNSYDDKKRSVMLQQWENEKRELEAKRRAAKREQQKSALETEKQRRAMAEKAWVEWKADAASKPKPVPLGQGLSTLRGTISSIYVNPNKWVKDIPSDED